MSAFRKAYIRIKSWLPAPIREALSRINQRLFARRTLKRKYGAWFDVDWRKHFRDLTEQDWKKAYDEAWKYQGNDCVEETDAQMILRALDSPGSVLDVGCGAGSLAMRLASEGFAVTGMDVSSEALKIARDRASSLGLGIKWKEGFAERMPFDDKSFDYVTCCHTLEHVKDLPAAVCELKRVARRKIVVLVPKQKFRLYAENYHTQFFDREEELAGVIGLDRFTCTEIDCIDHKNEFQGKAFLYVGYL